MNGRRIGTFFTLAERVGASIEDQAAKGSFLIFLTFIGRSKIKIYRLA